MSTSYLLYIPITAATLLVIHYLFQKRLRQLPPGPNGRFLIGNLHDLPWTEAERAKTYVEWRKDYGDIMHLDVMGGHMIVLNTLQATRDVMEKRAATYSGRPRMVMFTELAGADWFFSVMSGEPHKERRTVAQRYFLAQIKDWQHAQTESSRSLLRSLHANPDDWAELFRLSVASFVLQICYGHEVTRPDDPLLRIAQEAVESPRNGPYLVDHFPILKYYPGWLPGGQFQKDAKEARLAFRRLRYLPFDMVRSKMAAGTAGPSFVSTLLSQLPPDEDLEHSHQAAVIRDAAAIMYGVAGDSTASFLYTFMGCMVLNPDTQRRAQTELDSVLDQDRLPTFDDRSSLPYIDCIVLETYRWNVVTPLGFPHLATEEDEYLGYRIPKGSIMWGNNWAVLRDPEVFPNPNQFDPSRFLAATPGSAIARETIDSTVYGWGKRICPGRHVGSSALFITISHILACFDITKPLNNTGNVDVPVLKFRYNGLVRRACPTPCRISVRSEKIASLLSPPQ